MPQVAAALAEELLVLDCHRDGVAKTVSAEFAVEVLLWVEVLGSPVSGFGILDQAMKWKEIGCG